MSQIVSLYVIKEDLAWRQKTVLFAHQVPGDNARVFLPGDEEELVKFFKEEQVYTFTDPDKALDVEFWKKVAATNCSKPLEVSFPKGKHGRKPKNRKARNRNRQKYSSIAPRPTLMMRPVCIGLCGVPGHICQPCKLGHGVHGCHCAP